jgi:hypothetical protein
VDEPADPFESALPPEVVEHLRQSLPREAAEALERFLQEFSAARHDYTALLEQESWRALILASLTLAANDPVKTGATLVQAIGRARLAADPDGFADWMLR